MKLIPNLTIVTTLYYSESHILGFYQRLIKELKKLSIASYEIIFVNDGSPDNSLELALEIKRLDKNVIVIDLSRNFGHHMAIMEGLSYAKGEKVFLLDSDLEEPPEALGLFIERFNMGDCDVVYGVQKVRKGLFFERFFGALFYKLFNYLADTSVPENWTFMRMMSKRYVSSLLQFREKTSFLGGLMVATGYKQVPLVVHKTHKGTTTYNLRRKLHSSVSAITSFSNKPLQIILYSGIIISGCSFALILLILIQKIAFDIPISGWASIFVSIWFLGGVMIFFIGIIGLYISEIFVQSKNRPSTIIREIYDNTN